MPDLFSTIFLTPTPQHPLLRYFEFLRRSYIIGETNEICGTENLIWKRLTFFSAANSNNKDIAKGGIPVKGILFLQKLTSKELITQNILGTSSSKSSI